MLGAQQLFSSSDNVERRRSAAVFDTLWTFGGPADTVLAHTTFPRPDGSGGLIFFEMLDQVVHRLGPDGSLLWSWGVRGEGPGELQAVEALDVTPDGTVVLLDAGNRRVVRVSPNGQLLEERAMPAVGGLLMAVGVLEDRRLAVAGFHAGTGPRPHFMLSLWDDNAGVVEAGWPVQIGKPSIVRHQGRLVRLGGDGWVWGFTNGNGWMVFEGASRLAVHPYVEHTDFPGVTVERRGNEYREGRTERPVGSAHSLSVVEDTLFVLFEGEREPPGLRRRMLDRFNVRTGAYMDTDILPHRASRAVVDGDRVFTIVWGTLFTRIVTLARRSGDRPLSEADPAAAHGVRESARSTSSPLSGASSSRTALPGDSVPSSSAMARGSCTKR